MVGVKGLNADMYGERRERKECVQVTKAKNT